MNLAPVADVAIPGSVFIGRTYPGDPREVGRLVAAAVRGLQGSRVAATAKHFPGLGRATANTDDAPVTISTPATDLRAELESFRAAVDAGTGLVMVGHALYPTLDERRIASQSPAIVRGLLRRDLGFDGVIITDSLEAEAVLSRSSVQDAGARSIAAGADIALTTGQASFRLVFDELRRRAQRSDAMRARARTSAARVLALKRELGLRAPAPR